MTFDKLYGLFNAKCATDPQLRELRKKLVSNSADFSDTAAYSERISNLLGETLSKYINNIPQGSREQICKWLLQEQYNNINTICTDVQEVLDEAQGISLTAQKAVYPTKRIAQVAHALEDPTVKPEVIHRRANAPVANVAKSFHDDYIRVNSKQRNDLGLKPIIQRYGTGCCAWCSAVAGKYRFGEQPEDIFRRHDNCNCVIIYDNTVLRGKQTADGGRSKTWEEVDPKEVEQNPPKVLSQEEAENLQNFMLNRLTLAGKRDIIEETSKKPVTPITDNAINKVPKVKILGYTDEQCGYIQNQHKELLDYSRKNNGNKEVAFVFDNFLQNRREFTGADDRLDFGGTLYGKDLFIMHNHPRNSSFSDRDIRFVIGNDNIRTLTIVKNNGTVEILTKSEKYDKEKAMIELKRCYKKFVSKGTDSEINKAICAFLKNNKGVFIWTKI